MVLFLFVLATELKPIPLVEAQFFLQLRAVRGIDYLHQNFYFREGETRIKGFSGKSTLNMFAVK